MNCSMAQLQNTVINDESRSKHKNVSNTLTLRDTKNDEYMMLFMLPSVIPSFQSEIYEYVE